MGQFLLTEIYILQVLPSFSPSHAKEACRTSCLIQTNICPFIPRTKYTLWKMLMHIWDLSLLGAVGLLSGQCLGVSCKCFHLHFKLLETRGVLVDLLHLLTRDKQFLFSTKACHIEYVYSDSTHRKSLFTKFNHCENTYNSFTSFFSPLSLQ